MKKWERIRHSLQARVFHATIFGAFLLGVTMLVIGLALYTITLANKYISEAYGLAQSAAITLMVNEVDLEGMANEVLDVFEGLSQEEREQTGTEEYRKRFSFVMEKPDFVTTYISLGELRESSDMKDLYMAFFDGRNNILLYVCDPDPHEKTRFYPGEWEPVSEKEVQKFLTWEGEGKLYDVSNMKKYGFICTSGVPVFRINDDISCFVLADVTLTEVLYGVRNFVLQYTVAFLVILLILSRILTKRMKKMVVDPINEIAVAAQNYVEDRLKGNTSTDHFTNLNIHTGDEVENLSLVMADMEAGMAEYEEYLTRITAEKERIGTELALATKIQADMLPNVFPPFPERAEFDIYASMTPAKEVGGDFYDFFLIDDDHLAIVMADVSGKGVPAALFMMASKIIIANNVIQGKTPAQVLESTNNAICPSNREEMFVTVWLGILEISTGKLTAANAGHEYPVLSGPGQKFELVKDKHGLVIGGMEGVKYKEYEWVLEPGSRLFLYTDGVPEATNKRDELFGTERMVDALNEDPGASPVETLEAVQLAVDHFVEDAEQFDDLTMLCLEYTGPSKQ